MLRDSKYFKPLTFLAYQSRCRPTVLLQWSDLPPEPLAGPKPREEMCWIDSMMVWRRTMLKSGFRFRTSLLLVVRASDAWDSLIIGYLLELFWEGAPTGATMLMVLNSRVQAATSANLTVVLGGISIRRHSWRGARHYRKPTHIPQL
jgi:hypothetical protein